MLILQKKKKNFIVCDAFPQKYDSVVVVVVVVFVVVYIFFFFIRRISRLLHTESFVSTKSFDESVVESNLKTTCMN